MEHIQLKTSDNPKQILLTQMFWLFYLLETECSGTTWATTPKYFYSVAFMHLENQLQRHLNSDNIIPPQCRNVRYLNRYLPSGVPM